MRRSLLLSTIGAAVVAACTRGGAQHRGVQASISGATVPGALAAAPGRTTDAAGAVDNGGRTSSELARGGALSGVRPTEHQSPLPTGTPGTGTPLPLDPIEAKGRASEAPEGPAPAARRAPSALGELHGEWGTRLARARCDRENFCGGIGPGKAYPSQETCVATERARALDDIAHVPCDAEPGAPLAACLSEIRGAPCGVRSELGRGACSAAALCGS